MILAALRRGGPAMEPRRKVWLRARISLTSFSKRRWLAIARRKASACAAERATVTVLAWTLRVQRQEPGWFSPTLHSLSHSKVDSSCLQRSKRARKAATRAEERDVFM